MAKESIPPANLHGINHIRKASQVFPGGRKTLALMLSTVLLVLVFSTYYPAQVFYDSPMPTHTSHQMTITSMPLTH